MMSDLFNGWPEDGELPFQVPIFGARVLINPDTPDEAIVEFVDNKVFKIHRAFGPITRWLLNTGWFDGKSKR